MTPTPTPAILTVQVRAWLYSIVAAVVPLLVTLGVVTDSIAGNILAIAAATLAIGTSVLALGNLSPDKGDHAE